VNAETISIGDELTAGRIADTNAAYLAGELHKIGIRVRRMTTVGDRREDILDALGGTAERAEISLVTGGIGPTPDDLTRSAMAELCGAPLVTVPEAEEQLRRFFARLGRKASPSNFVQSRIPRGARWLPNPLGTAAGFSVRHGRCLFFVLPGVPGEMRRMFRESVLPVLRPLSPGVTLARELQAYGLGESVIGERLRDLMTRRGEIEVATLAHRGVITIRLTATAPDADGAKARLAEAEAEVLARLGDAVFDHHGRSLAEVVAELLRRAGLTLAVAESCTGGELAARITDIPGISEVFLEGAVTYSNEAKISRLGVPRELIARFGAVSAPVAEAMASGIRRTARADVALGITGIAGPAGGSAEKPVGLVYIAVADAHRAFSEEAHFVGDRQQIRDRAVARALHLLRAYLKEQVEAHES